MFAPLNRTKAFHSAALCLRAAAHINWVGKQAQDTCKNVELPHHQCTSVHSRTRRSLSVRDLWCRGCLFLITSFSKYWQARTRCMKFTASYSSNKSERTWEHNAGFCAGFYPKQLQNMRRRLNITLHSFKHRWLATPWKYNYFLSLHRSPGKEGVWIPEIYATYSSSVSKYQYCYVTVRQSSETSLTIHTRWDLVACLTYVRFG